MFKKIIIFLLKLGLLGSVLLALFIGTVLVGGFGPIPSSKDLAVIKQSEASIVYSADQEILGKFFFKNRTQVSYSEIPKHIIEALVATEDVRFYEHDGIDKIAMLRVLIKTIILGNSSAGGGSTLSQQLAKNLFHRKNFSYLSMPVNKTKEAILANRLEHIYNKSDIVTLYLNTVPFGEGVYGIETAAQRYFSSSVKHLSVAQGAVLIGMLKANTYYNPRKYPDHALRRRNVVLNQMLKANFISEDTYEKASLEPLKTNYKNLLLQNPNGYYLQKIKQKARNILSEEVKSDGSQWILEQDGLIIETTLNSELQNAALEARKVHLKKLQKSMDYYWGIIKKKPAIKKIIEKEWEATKDYKRYKKLKLNYNTIIDSAKAKDKRLVFDWQESNKRISRIDSIHHYLKMVSAAVYGMNIKTGAVQVYVGGNSYEYLPYNLITSERQAASTFKPFVYTAALENGQKPCDWINNEVKTYAQYDDWKPENYDHSEGGYFSMPGALAKSMNIPTIETYINVGNKNLQNTVDKLGLTKKLNDLPSTALGATNYSLESLVQAYTPFATKSLPVEPFYISSIKSASGEIIYTHKIKLEIDDTQEDDYISEETLETMQYLLKGVVDKGTASRLKTKYKVNGDWAGKTGTSQNYSDSWFIAFNSDFIIGTWVGCKYPIINLAPGSGGGSIAALPIAGQVISKTYKDKQVNKSLSAGFPEFNQTTIEACDCEFFREENTLEKLFDLFDKNKNKPKKEKGEKKGFFSKLFGKKSKD
ncbi:transglycosylase domain-containing protein [Flavicella sp.]|uniref:transglycosylase domain-containing protein n=1 Tax=Flavicella sp. TaxID=2957742 RepID=UPI0026261812|nr:transglycosylase domain-containing protein [Flavicella sp.]MDG1804483.1 transglycosylase domain-containing protein [Flavicella sp.]